MATFYASVISADADAAIAFLDRAFGITEHELHRDETGTIRHGELRLGDGIVMIGTQRDDAFATSGTVLVYAAVDRPEDVDALHERAAAAGAEIVLAPTDTDYGSRDFAAKDPEGNVWSFGTYRPKP